MEGGGQRKRKVGAIHLDWDKLLPDDSDQPPPAIVVERVKTESEKMGGWDEESPDLFIKKASDSELIDRIARYKRTLPVTANLPDGGAKYRDMIRRHEAELESRELARKCKDQNNNATQSDGAPDVLPPVKSLPASTSTFSRLFGSKLDDSKEDRSFSNELSLLNPCDKKDPPEIRRLSSQRNEGTGVSLREMPFKSPRQLSVNLDDSKRSNSQQFRGNSASASPHQSYRYLSDVYAKTEPSHMRTRRGSRQKDEAVVLLDEEFEVLAKDKAGVDQRMKDFQIYYPSRDDPEAVDICYSDIECLDPESYLTSGIMNFYIKYLQREQSSNSSRRDNYHFFNTYFYSKLKQDVLSKVDKETPFVKFRRWWKGVNIFEKAYLLMPINQSRHWSLVIVCMPSKEDESGPIILHLDSLGMHPSRMLFSDVRNFLIEEWRFLRQKPLPEPPMANSTWDKLSRRISEKVLAVPQQKNDYDCGLFVLYFIERFIEDAPERLQKQDLEKNFGRNWFKPEDASNLRRKIRDILDEFKKSNSENGTCKSDL